MSEITSDLKKSESKTASDCETYQDGWIDWSPVTTEKLVREKEGGEAIETEIITNIFNFISFTINFI